MTSGSAVLSDVAPQANRSPSSASGGTGRLVTRRSTGTATLDDVAAHAGVSPATVSRAIRAPDMVSESTLERVRSSIVATGYVRNLAASNLASNRSMTVAALIPAISASVFADALHGLEEVLSPAGYQLVIGSTGYREATEDALVRALLGRRPDGLFFVGTQHSAATTQLLREARVPTVETWDLTDTPIDSVVGFSNRDAARALVQFVHDRGYRRPTFAGSFQTGDFRALTRRAAFASTVAELWPGEPVRIVDSGTATVDLDTGGRLLELTLRTHPETDVLLLASDVFAAGALLAGHRRGLRIPNDLALTGFGDFEIGRHLSPTLTTVAVPNRQIGTVAGELLLSRMSGRTTESTTVDLGYSVVARESA